MDDKEKSALRWMRYVNARDRYGSRGLYGPSLRKGYEFPECERLVRCGYAERDSDGYWITEAGRAALAAESVSEQE